MIGHLEHLGTNWGGFHAQGDPETKCPTDLAWMVNGPDGWVDAGEDAKVMDAAAARFLPQQQQQQRFQQQQYGGPPARFLPQQQQRFQQQQQQRFQQQQQQFQQQQYGTRSIDSHSQVR